MPSPRHQNPSVFGPTPSPGGPGPGAVDTLHVPGLTGNGLSDNGPAIQAVLDKIGASGNTHSYDVLAEVDATGYIFINSTVQVRSDHTTLRFGSPVVFGANGRLRLNGELVETPTSGKPRLTADSAEGDFTITVNNPAPFAAGDYIVIRGAREATGSASGEQKQECSVASVVGNVITLNEPLADPFLAYNTNPLAPSGTTHFTEVTKVTASTVTGAANRNDRTITIGSTAEFAAGDYIQILDRANTTKPDGTLEPTNYKHREIAKVVQVISGTVLRISHALAHTYDLTKSARVAKLSPVRHSAIKDVSVTWSEMSTVGNAFEIKYGVNCEIRNCQLAGDTSRTKSWKSQAFRQTDSYLCQVVKCTATAPAVTTSGRGYGATLYGATQCAVRESQFSGLRHSVLLFNGASLNLIEGCHSEDCSISDYDLHGAECRDNVITGCVAVGGDSAADDGSVNKTACKAGNTTHSEGDHGNVFSNMTIVNYKGAAYEVVPASTGNTFRDSTVNGAWYAVKLTSNSANTALLTTDTVVVNCDFTDISTSLVNVNGNSVTSMIRGLTIEGCRFKRPTTSLVVSYAQKLRLRRNTFSDPAMSSSLYAVTATGVTGLVVRANDFSEAPRGFKLTGCPGARINGNTIHDLTQGTVYEDAGGNDGALVARNEAYGYIPAVTVSGTGPSAGGLIDVGIQYVSDAPSRHGFIDWNYDPIMTGSAAGQALTTGTIYLVKMTPQIGGVVSNIVVAIGSTAPAGTLTSGQNLMAVYDSAGNRLGITSDQTTAWATSGVKSCALTAPITLAGGKDYYVAALTVSGAGTGAAFVRNNAGAVTTPNAGFSSTSAYRFATNGTAQTALPSTLTLSSNSGSGAQPLWVAFS